MRYANTDVHLSCVQSNSISWQTYGVSYCMQRWIRRTPPQTNIHSKHNATTNLPDQQKRKSKNINKKKDLGGGPHFFWWR